MSPAGPCRFGYELIPISAFVRNLEALTRALAKLPGAGGAEWEGGGIGIAKDGRIGWAHNSPDFALALIASDMPEPKAYLRKDEEKSG